MYCVFDQQNLICQHFVYFILCVYHAAEAVNRRLKELILHNLICHPMYIVEDGKTCYAQQQKSNKLNKQGHGQTCYNINSMSILVDHLNIIAHYLSEIWTNNYNWPQLVVSIEAMLEKS